MPRWDRAKEGPLRAKKIPSSVFFSFGHVRPFVARPVRGAHDGQDVGVVYQPIHGRRGQKRVLKQFRPFLQVEVGSYHQGAFLVTFADDLVEVIGARSVENQGAWPTDNTLAFKIDIALNVYG